MKCISICSLLESYYFIFINDGRNFATRKLGLREFRHNVVDDTNSMVNTQR